MKPNEILTPGTFLCHDENIVSRRILDEHLLVPISRTAGEIGSIYTLNEVAAFVWERLDGVTSVDKICKAVSGEFAVDPATAANDVMELLEQLHSLGAVREP